MARTLLGLCVTTIERHLPEAAMQKKLATDLMRANQEAVEPSAEDGAPRENSSRQEADGNGLRRPRLDAWTTPELREMAEGANIRYAEIMDRDELIDALVLAQLRRQGGQAV